MRRSVCCATSCTARRRRRRRDPPSLVVPASVADAGQGRSRLVLALCLWLPGADCHSHGGRTSAGDGASGAGVMWIAIVLSFLSFCVALWAFWSRLPRRSRTRRSSCGSSRCSNAPKTKKSRGRPRSSCSTSDAQAHRRGQGGDREDPGAPPAYETSIAIDSPLGSKRVQ